MILYFLRHANAGERLATPKKDEKRALDKDGIEQCGYVGRALAAMDVQVDLIVSSPLKRSTQTAVLGSQRDGSRRQVDYRSRTSSRREFF
jgi:phosphohistidine phosphatase